MALASFFQFILATVVSGQTSHFTKHSLQTPGNTKFAIKTAIYSSYLLLEGKIMIDFSQI